MNKKHLTEAEQQELLLRMKKNYTYDAKSGRLTSSRYGRAIRGGKRNKRGYLFVKHDNRIENLREVSQSENNMNVLHPWKPNAKTGLPGVNKHGSSYRIKVGQHHYHFCDKYVAFYHLTLLGRKYK